MKGFREIDLIADALALTAENAVSHCSVSKWLSASPRLSVVE